MSNTIQNPGIIDLREDHSAWNASGNFETPDYKDFSNPAVQARAEYENDLYINALNESPYNDRESVAVETAQPIAPVREGGMQVNELERVPGQGEVHGYATHDGRAIDPAHAEAALSAARATVTDAYKATEQAAPAEVAVNQQEFILHASRLAGRLGEGLTVIRQNTYTNWGASSDN